MHLRSLELFLRIAELGSISAGAAAAHLSPASASARLARLEAELGFRLFHRTTRALSLTSDGVEFMPYARQTLETLEDGRRTVAGEQATPRGRLRMTLPGSFGRMHVLPRLGAFKARYPDVELDLHLSDQVTDLVQGAFDLAIRNAPVEDGSFVARRLAPDRRILAAAPDYLKAHGTPESRDDLARHHWVLLGNQSEMHFADGTRFRASADCVVDDGEAMRILLEAGFGIGMKAMWNAADALADGRLVEVLPQTPLAEDAAIWALYPSNRIVAPKVRAMIDFLLECFDPVPWARA